MILRELKTFYWAAVMWHRGNGWCLKEKNKMRKKQINGLL